jgi:DNA-binding transcriptional regulator YhcF (GntR family)
MTTEDDDQRALDHVRDMAESGAINARSMLAPYIQIALYLRGSIITGQLPVGSPMPSEPELAERYHVSRETVRRAIGLLRDLGLTETRRGSGTFVATVPQVQRVEVEPGARVLVRMPQAGEISSGLGYAVLVVTEPGRDPVAYDSATTLLVVVAHKSP